MKQDVRTTSHPSRSIHLSFKLIATNDTRSDFNTPNNNIYLALLRLSDSFPHPIAPSMGNLKGESAFQVALDAREYQSRTGGKVYPFHLGDVAGKGFSLPALFQEGFTVAFSSGKTTYGPASGLPELRKALAEKLGRERNIVIDPEQVSVQPGGKSALAKIFLALVKKGDVVIFPSPGYPIYDSWASYLGAKSHTYGLTADQSGGCKLDMKAIKEGFKRGAKIIVLNDDHNPTGYSLSEAERKELVRLCKKYDAVVISDEAYFNIHFDKSVGHSIISEEGMQDRTIISWTASKEYFATGERIGAVVGPLPVIKAVNQLNGNIESCTSTPTQVALTRIITQEASYIEDRTARLEILSKRRDAVVEGLKAIPGIQVPFTPKSGFYVWADITDLLALTGHKDPDSLRKAVLNDTGVSFCCDTHFGPVNGDRRCIRFAFSGIEQEDIITAMTLFKKWVETHTLPSENRVSKSAPVDSSLSGEELKVKNERFIVRGAGPMAQLITGRLLLAGAEKVALITNHGGDIKTDGISIRQQNTVSTAYPKVTDSAHLPKHAADWVLVTTQLGDGQTIEDLRTLVKGNPGIPIVVFRNGIHPSKEICDAFPDNPVIEVAVSVQIRYGEDRHTLYVPKELAWEMGIVQSGKTHPEVLTSRLTALTGFLNKTGFTNVQLTDDLPLRQALKYLKNMGNLGSFYVELTRHIQATYQDSLTTPGIFEKLITPLVKEAHSILTEVVKQQNALLELPPVEACLEQVQNYLKTDHVPTTVENHFHGKPVENLLTAVIEYAGTLNKEVALHKAFFQLIAAENEKNAAQKALRSTEAPVAPDSDAYAVLCQRYVNAHNTAKTLLDAIRQLTQLS